MTAETTSRRNAPAANGGYADTASGDGREAEWTRQKNERPLPSRTQPGDAASWQGGTTVRTAQASTVASKDATGSNASGGVRVSGSEQDIALFCKQIKETSGLDVRVADGKLAIIGEDKGKGNKATAQAIRDSVNSKDGINAILERDTATFGDSFNKGTIDVGDIQIAMQDNKELAGALLTHIFVERTYAAEHKQADFQTAHEAALKREGGVFCDAKGCATEPPGTLNHEPGDQKDRFLRLHRVYTGDDGRVLYDAILTQEKTEDGRYVFNVKSKKGQ
jgi:hypothetical protein